MKLNEMNNLFVGYSKEDDFRICIIAEDKIEAYQIAKEYAEDSGLGEFEIGDLSTCHSNDLKDLNFDIDYILTK